MKHLKRFNESIDVNELQDFCKMSLAYLIDDGFNINIDQRFIDIKTPRYGSGFVTIQFDRSGYEFREDTFNWDDIKDYFIPFMSLLDKNFILKEWGNPGEKESVRVSYRRKSMAYGYPEKYVLYKLSDVLQDKLESDNPIYRIDIIVDIEKR